MWDLEGFLEKAESYMSQAQRLDNGSPAKAVLLLAGLEFLLRAPLAAVSPVLLADPSSVMAAAGYPQKTAGNQQETAGNSQKKGLPKSIPMNDVLARLKRVIDPFGEALTAAEYLFDLRNEEMHSSRQTLVLTDVSDWLPRLHTVVSALAGHLQQDIGRFLDAPTIARARALECEHVEKTEARVKGKLAASKDAFGRLDPAVIDGRVRQQIWQFPDGDRGPILFPDIARVVRPPTVTCPACSYPGDAEYPALGSLEPQLLADAGGRYLQSQAERMFREFHCQICGLAIEDPAEARAVGFPVEYRASR